MPDSITMESGTFVEGVIMEKIKEISDMEVNKTSQDKRVIQYATRLAAMKKEKGKQGKLDERR